MGICKPLNLPELKNIFSLFSEELSRLDPSASLCKDLVDGKGSAWVGLELLRCFTGTGRHTLPVLAQAILERIGQTIRMVRSLVSSKQPSPPSGEVLAQLRQK